MLPCCLRYAERRRRQRRAVVEAAGKSNCCLLRQAMLPLMPCRRHAATRDSAIYATIAVISSCRCRRRAPCRCANCQVPPRHALFSSALMLLLRLMSFRYASDAPHMLYADAMSADIFAYFCFSLLPSPPPRFDAADILRLILIFRCFCCFSVADISRRFRADILACFSPLADAPRLHAPALLIIFAIFFFLPLMIRHYGLLFMMMMLS